ncbi:16S rRNA (adenine(1518)-N(6)/adenine(1519)-N(6))-dimethyltransferase RsmA [Mycoplasma sp. P36-A1]|uniref:16S rRNA (adenine(1518)-N(6)/adenine(1519)-N(6))- dimethyltransferase RsmA n=1 Tax=Mycoplasma sp. P36-A1 TaxID=3252900 RepID=UPI003C2DBEFB
MNNQDIATKSKTLDILKKYNMVAKKNYGQNFLVDNNIVRNIVAQPNIDKNTNVLEIGPGIGSLTEQLAKVARKVVSVEIDTKLKDVLEDTLQDYDNIDIVYEDFLKVDLKELVAKHFDPTLDLVVVANLPYYITTPILIKLFENQSSINLVSITAMMQKEVANRLSAKKDTKDYNSLTILTQYYSEAKIVIKVPKNVFIPAPNVDSAVVLFTIKKEQNKPENEQLFFKLLRVLFKQRRKTILNNLNELYDDKIKTKQILDALNLDSKLRAENLTLQQIIDLSNYIAKE